MAPHGAPGIEPMIGFGLLLACQAAQLVVGPGARYATLQAALSAARAGDTVRVLPGLYTERVVVDRPITLVGESGAVLSAQGRGTVITVLAPAVIRGLEIRDSGDDQSREDAGILANQADHVVVEGNRLVNVLFGVYVKQGKAPVIRHNEIEGKDLPFARRGDGIRLWYSDSGLVEHNRVRRVRDLVIWFANHATIRDNRVSESRYGLHYMYSHHSRFDRNVFEGNEVGAFIMYSGDIAFRDNVFADARGPSGRGLGFKDADSILAEGNVVVKNAVGLSLDNSPHAEGTINLVRENVIAYNDVGVELMPSVRNNAFLDNRFIENVVPVRVSGGGTAVANRWAGNYWSEYAGFDPDGDGIGNTPFRYERLSDDLLAKYPALQLFQASLAVAALNTLSRVLPLLGPEPIVVDSLPRIRPQPGRLQALAPAARGPDQPRP
jgi:nitrous oxidase accessory protein